MIQSRSRVLTKSMQFNGLLSLLCVSSPDRKRLAPKATSCGQAHVVDLGVVLMFGNTSLAFVGSKVGGTATRRRGQFVMNHEFLPYVGDLRVAHTR